MAGRHPNPEMVAVGWLKAALSPFAGVATQAPALAEWPVWSGAVKGFVVVDGVVGGSTRETALRQPIVSVSAWAALASSDKPQWNAASDIMETIMYVLVGHAPVSLSWTGYASALVSSAWPASGEPRRIADVDNSGRAHYVLDVGMTWTEV